MSTKHTATRAYVYQCTYDSASWIDNPATMISDLQTALSGISNFSYNWLKVANVKNTSGSKIEIEINGIYYNSKTQLSSAEIDSLLSDLNTVLLTITDLYFLYIDICADVFLEDPTAGWVESWKRG